MFGCHQLARTQLRAAIAVVCSNHHRK